MSEVEHPQATVTDSTRESLWHSVIDLSKEMKRFASTRQWEELAVLVRQRHVLLTRHFSRWAINQDAQSLENDLDRLAGIDRDILVTVNDAREQTAARLARIEQGKKALRAYQMN